MKGKSLENKLIVKKEMSEFCEAVGYIAGEFHEVTKDGFGMEDVKSVADTAKNYPMLKEGFEIEVKMSKENLAQLEKEDIIEILMKTVSGFNKGAK